MNPELQRKLALYVYFLAGISMCAGLIGITGWIFRVPSLITLFDHSVSIKFNTALSLFCLGFSLFCAQKNYLDRAPKYSTFYIILRICFALVPALIGLLTFLQYAFGWDFGIDQLVFQDYTRLRVGHYAPGRMAFNTSVAFLFLGLALSVVDWEPFKKKRPAQYLSCGAALLSFPAIIIYLYGISFSHGIAPYVQMAIYTAVSVFCVSTGILLSRPDKGFLSFLFGESIAGVLLRNLFPSAVIMPLALGIVALTGARQGFYDTDFALTLAVIMCILIWLTVLTSTTKQILIMEEKANSLELERTRLFQEREAEMSLFQTVLETIPSAVIVAEAPKGNIVFANSQLLKVWGHELIPSKAIHEYMDWKGFYDDGTPYKATDWPLARAVMSGETVIGEDVNIVRGDNKKAILRLSSAPIKNKENNITGGVVICEDVTELRQAEKLRIKLLSEQQSASAIKHSEVRLRSIFDSAFEAIITNDALGTITEWNPRAESMFQYKREEAIGKKIHELIMPEKLRGKYLKATQKFYQTGHGPLLNKKIEIEAVRRNGEIFPIELSVSVNQREDVFIFTSFIDDITQRKKSERELIEAREKALEAAKVKSEFLANMSHEIRTPLNAVIGLTDILQEGALSSEQSKYVHLIQESGNHLLNVINDILDFSKIEAGRMVLEKIDFNLKHLLENTSELLKHKVQEKGLQFQLTIDPQVPREVMGDPGRLGQVLINLIANAIKFTDFGKISVSVKLLKDDPNGPVLIFSVQDSGIGMSEEASKKLFNPFVQGDGSTNRRYGGTGLGLSICKRIVELMGGEIQVSSKEEEGSEFWFTATFEAASKSNVITEVKETTSTAALASLNSANKHKRILVAEDNSTNQLLTLAQLKSLGYTAQAVANGIEAVEAFQKNTFDLILMDCQMPDMDGFEATQKIRSMEKTMGGHIPIVALTANALKEDERRCLDAGMDAYLSKPTKKERLGRMISQLLSVSDSLKKAS